MAQDRGALSGLVTDIHVFPVQDNVVATMAEDLSDAPIVIAGPDPDYYQALGQFIETFSCCESVLFSVLTFYAGVNIPVAKALFANTRMEAAIRYIERIAEARSMVVERRADFLAAEADN